MTLSLNIPANLLSDLAERARGGTPPSAGRQVRIGLIGRGIGASRSPAMHRREGTRLGLDYSYSLIDFDALALPNAALADIVSAAEQAGFAGLNITHPFKQSILPHLTGLSPEADAIGAVNTIVFDRGARIGHNTDSWGFAESFRENMGGCSLAHVLQFGAGGAGAAVAYALLELGAATLSLCDIEPDRAKALVLNLKRRFGDRVRCTANTPTAFTAATGIVNATPVGMAKYPGMPFAPNELEARHWVAEIIYFPLETDLLRAARRLDCRSLSGIGMAVNQAVRAFELFTGLAPDRLEMRRHFEIGASSDHVPATAKSETD